MKFFIAAEDGDETWNGTGSAHLSDSFYMGDSSMTSEPESSTPARRPRERTRSTKILISSGETFETAAHDLLDLYQFDDEHLDRTEDMHDMVDNSFVDLDRY